MSLICLIGPQIFISFSMTKSAVVFTDKKSGHDAGNSLAEQINQQMEGIQPDVVILFASSVYEYQPLLSAIKKQTGTPILIGSSSAGEFTMNDFGTDSACAIAIKSDDIKFSAGIGHGIKESREQVASKLLLALETEETFEYRYRSAMIFADALSGYTDELIDLLTEKTIGRHQFFGGGAGDNANFQKTDVFLNEEYASDSAVILEILSNKPVGVGVSHGWRPTGEKMRVTEAQGMQLISLNGTPAVELFVDHALNTNQEFNPEAPIPFFLHNVLGIEMADGHKLRVPLGIQPDGSLMMASDIPVGAYVSFMTTDNQSSQTAAMQATTAALSQMGGNKPSVALFFDCVATRLRMGKDFGYELNEVKEALPGLNYAGCNTYGQVARVNGQFNGFHNCTAVVCVLPE